MNEFVKNNEMEVLISARDEQPELFAKLPPTLKMSLGIYENAKQQVEKTQLSADDRLRLNGFKQQIAQDVLSPHERTALAIKIQNLEKNK